MNKTTQSAVRLPSWVDCYYKSTTLDYDIIAPWVHNTDEKTRKLENILYMQGTEYNGYRVTLYLCEV